MPHILSSQIRRFKETLFSPEIQTFFKGATIYTICVLIGIALSKWGTDPLSRFIRAYLYFLFLTPYGWIILCAPLVYRLVRWFLKSRRK